LRILLTGSVLLAAWTGVARADAPCARDGDCPAPEVCRDRVCVPAAPAAAATTRTEYQNLRGLWLPGIPILAGSYALTVVVNAAATPNDGKRIGLSMIPVLGPWILLSDTLPDYHGPLVVAGLSQAAGLALLAVGLLVEQPVEVPIGPDSAELRAPRLYALPTAIGVDGAGLVLGIGGF
jgi:hypothetical protein